MGSLKASKWCTWLADLQLSTWHCCYCCMGCGAGAAASAGSCLYQPRSCTSATRRPNSGMELSVEASPTSTSLHLARVMATLMRRQSASSLPAGQGAAQGGRAQAQRRKGRAATSRGRAGGATHAAPARGICCSHTAVPRIPHRRRLSRLTRLRLCVAAHKADGHKVLVPPLALVHRQHLHITQPRATSQPVQQRNLRGGRAAQRPGGAGWASAGLLPIF